MRRWLFVALALVLVAVAVPAVRDARDSEGESTLAKARAYREYRVFWLGERYRSNDMTGVSLRAAKDLEEFNFSYGDCKAESDAGCALPYSVQNYDACERNLSTYSHVDPERHKPIRGAAVYEFGDGNNLDQLEVYTGRTTVVIHAPTAAEALGAARALESVNWKLGPDDPLGPPARGALEGKLPCGAGGA